VNHVHEPVDTHCPSPDCGRPMVRVGEDVSERLDIVPTGSSCIGTCTAARHLRQHLPLNARAQHEDNAGGPIPEGARPWAWAAAQARVAR
jgi:hypothetical protein